MKITAVTGNYISFGVHKAIVYCLFQSNRIRLSARGTIFEDTIFRCHETNTRTRYVYELYPENVDTIPDIIRAVHKKYQQQVFVER